MAAALDCRFEAKSIFWNFLIFYAGTLLICTADDAHWVLLGRGSWLVTTRKAPVSGGPVRALEGTED